MADIKSVLIILLGSLLLLGGMAYWFTKDATRPELILDRAAEEAFLAPLTPEEAEVVSPSNTNESNPIASMVTNKGTIEIELFADTMPITTDNFIRLAERGFYEQVKFHRVLDNFMIQAGDPNTKTEEVATYGFGGPGYSIKDEFVEGELLTNTRGTIAMANSGPNTGGSQFFINLRDNSPLDFNNDIAPESRHPVFGRVIAGMDVVDAIAKSEVTKNSGGEPSLPVDPIIIQSVVINR